MAEQKSVTRWVVTTEEPYGGACSTPQAVKVFNTAEEAEAYSKTLKLHSVVKSFELASDQVWLVLSEECWGGLNEYPERSKYVCPDGYVHSYDAFSVHDTQTSADETKNRLPVDGIVLAFIF